MIMENYKNRSAGRKTAALMAILGLVALVAACGQSSDALRKAKEAANSEAGKKLIAAAKNQAGAALAGGAAMGDPKLVPAAITGFPSGKGELPGGYFRSWFNTHRNLIYSTVQGLPAGSVLQVTGHSDPLGGPGLAQSLSDARARYIYDQLLRTGIPAGRLTFRGIGAQNLANKDFVGAAENRRVTFQVVAAPAAGGNNLVGLANRALNAAGAQTTGNASVDSINKQLQTLTISGFESGKSSMKASYMNVWRRRADPIIGQLRYGMPPGYILEVQGHSDPIGGYRKAQSLAIGRARFVYKALRNMGIPASRMRSVSRAAAQLANPNWVGAGENRRVTLQLVPGYGGGSNYRGGNYGNYNYNPNANYNPVPQDGTQLPGNLNQLQNQLKGTLNQLGGN